MSSFAKDLPVIKVRQVSRFMAPYFSASGRIAYKGFSTAMSAAKFIAKQDIYDEVLGPKEMIYDSMYPDDNGFLHRKALPKEEFAKKMFDFGFQCSESIDYYGEPIPCCAETYGFCGYKFKQEVTRRAKLLVDKIGSSATD